MRKTRGSFERLSIGKEGDPKNVIEGGNLIARRTIEVIVTHKICSGCGTCAGLCPTDSILMTSDVGKGIFVPKVGKACNDCGLCLRVCHRAERLEPFQPGSSTDGNTSLIGSYIGSYSGYSTDMDRRKAGSSGGLVTEILLRALESGLITGAVVTRMDEENPLKPITFIARTKEEILQCAGSKYCPAPVNMILREVLESGNDDRLAFVGLPCHMEGLSKAISIRKDIDNKIVLKLGLFCNHVPSFWGTKAFISELELDEDQISGLSYRGNGHPGKTLAGMKNGMVRGMSFPKAWKTMGSSLFYPTGCLICNDALCEGSDISFGDAWLPEFYDDTMGTSLIILRSIKGGKILDYLMKSGTIIMAPISIERVIRSQRRTLFFKKASIKPRASFYGQNVRSSMHKIGLLDKMFALYFIINSQIVSRFVKSHILQRLLVRLAWIGDETTWKIALLRSGDFPRNSKMKIGVVNHTSRLNKGTAALLKTRVRLINEAIPDVRFEVFALDTDFTPDMDYLEGIDIGFNEQVFSISNSHKSFFQKFLEYMKNCMMALARSKGWCFTLKDNINNYVSCDCILSTGGDMLTEDYGLPSFLITASNLILGKWIGKPIIIYAESVGPFRSKIGKMFARYLFKNSALIMLRDEISIKHLHDIGINVSSVVMTTDSAFLLEPSPPERIDDILAKEGIHNQGTRMVGIAPSKIIAKYGFEGISGIEAKYDTYTTLMARLIEYVNSEFQAEVLLVPHVLGPGDIDDRLVARDIMEKIDTNVKCIAIEKEYSAEEIKGIIGRCDLFIGSRMHSTIASTSMGVPTIAIAYSHKTYGIIGIALNQNDFILDVANISYDSLVEKIDDIWETKETIREQLLLKMDSIKQEAINTGRIVTDLLKKMQNESLQNQV